MSASTTLRTLHIVTITVTLLTVSPRALAQAPISNGSLPTTSRPSPSPAPDLPPFELLSIVNHTFGPISRLIPPALCPARRVRYSLIINNDNRPFKVPHSRISTNGKPCGPLPSSATFAQLWADSHMLVVPISYLSSKDTARRYGALAIYNLLFENRPYTRSFFNFSKTTVARSNASSNVYVGVERYTSRVCGDSASGRITLPIDTFIFIGQFSFSLDFSAFVPFERSLLLPKYAPFHISFALPAAQNVESTALREVVCPLVLPTPTPAPRMTNIRYCFPAIAHAMRPDGTVVTMPHLRVGDRVLDAQHKPSSIIAFSHRDRSRVVRPFVRLVLAGPTDRASPSRVTLLLSEGHFMMTTGCASLTSLQLTTARDVRIGDAVCMNGNKVLQVIHKNITFEAGLFNPHTASGSILVNGIAVSCYTDAVKPNLAHALLAPVRAFVKLLFFFSC